MLIGQYTSKLTDKGRISVPKKFRQQLGEELIVAKWYESCLVLVPKGDWKKLLRRLVGLTDLVISPVRDIDRFILGSAFEVKPDKQGRFIVPEPLLEYAEIESEAVFVGLTDRVEIWSLERWKLLEERAEEKASQAIERIAKRKV